MKHNPETAALNDLLSTLNNPSILGVTPIDQRDEVDKAHSHPGPKIETTKLELPEGYPAPKPKIEPPQKLPPVKVNLPAPVQKLFFTGRTNVGKDYAAASAGATIFGFADPIYAIASHFFGVPVGSNVGKDLPGMRAFLQVVGQWGRGITSEQYPLTVPRALFIDRVREDGGNGSFGFPEVDWSSYGRNSDIWLDACIAGANNFLAVAPSNTRVAITNCRFDNEFKRLVSEGYQHWHVMVSPATWTKRLLASKLTPESPALKDVSELLASNLDNNVIKQLSAAKHGAKLRAIWNDDVVPPPSNRLHSLASFLQSIKGGQ